MADSRAAPASQDRSQVWLGLGLVVLAAGLRLWGASVPNLWNDEVISVTLAQSSWMGLFRGAVKDIVHPPLFYALLKVWIAAGGLSESWMRLLPIFASLASLVPAVLLAKELGLSRSARRLGLFLICCSGLLIHYAQELRMYSLLQLFSVTSIWLFARFVRRTERPVALLAALALVNGAMVFTQYYGWLVVGLEGLFLLLTRRSKLIAFTLAMLPVAVAFAPWAWLVAGRARAIGGLDRNLAGLARPGWRDALAYYGSLIGPAPEMTPGPVWMLGALCLWGPIAWLVSGLPAVAGSATGAPVRRQDSPEILLAYFSIAPVLVSLIASQILPQPVFHPRYMIIAAVPFLLLAGMAVDGLRPPLVRAGMLALAVGLALAGAFEEVRLPNRIAWGELTKSMRKASAGASQEAGSGHAAVYVIGRGNARPIRYYLAREGDDGFEVRLISNPAEIESTEGWIAYQDSSGEPRLGALGVFWGGLSSAEVRSGLALRGLRVGSEFQSGLRKTVGHLESFQTPAPEVRP